MSAEKNRTPRRVAGSAGSAGTGPVASRRPRRSSRSNGYSAGGRATPRDGARGGKVSESAARVARRADAAARVRTNRSSEQVLRNRRRRQLLTTALGPNLVALLAIIVVVFGGLLVTGAPLGWLPAVVSGAWMVLNLAPIHAGGVTVSLLPLLPALLFAGLISWRVNRTIRQRVSIRDLLILSAWIVGIPVVITLLAAAVLAVAGDDLDMTAPPLGRVLIRVVLFHLVAYAVGFGPRLWKALIRHYQLPALVFHCGRIAVRLFLALVGLTTVFLLVMLVLSWGRQQDMIAGYPHLGAAGMTGLIGLTVLYLPNAVISALGVIVGADFHAAAANVSLFDIHLVPLPPMPWFAVIPPRVPEWAVGLLALTAAVLATVWIRLHPSGARGVVTSFGAACGTALLALIACYFAGGELGSYGPTGPHMWLTAGLVGLWSLATGLAVTAAFAAMNRLRPSESANGETGAGDAETNQPVSEEAETNQPVPGEKAQQAVVGETGAVDEQQAADESEATEEQEPTESVTAAVEATENPDAPEAEVESATEPEPEPEPDPTDPDATEPHAAEAEATDAEAEDAEESAKAGAEGRTRPATGEGENGASASTGSTVRKIERPSEDDAGFPGEDNDD